MPHTKKQKLPIPHSKRRIILSAVAVLIALIVLWIYTNSTNWRNDVVRQEDVPYCGTNDKLQTLDYYRPEHSGDQNLPLLVYIHGGGWRGGGKRNGMINNYGQVFIKHNIAVASLSYRLNSAHPYPDQNDDIACALTYLTANATTLHIDPSKIILMGESAGGELAAFAALHIPYKSYVYATPAGVIDFYGVSDFTKIINSKKPDLNARRFLGKNYAQNAAGASPITYVAANAPRFLLFHGENDTVVPIDQSMSLYNLLTAQHVNATFIKIPNAAHAFVGPELQPSSYKIILDTIDTFLKGTVGR